MTSAEDYWADDDFENTVAAALIACYETKVKKARGAAPEDRLNDARLLPMRNMGPYIASSSRLFDMQGILDGGPMHFDMVNDPLPKAGCLAWEPPRKESSEKEYGGYLISLFFRRAQALGKNWHRRGTGTLFERFLYVAGKDGMEGERSFFSVADDGLVTACEKRISSVRGYVPGKVLSTISTEAHILREHEVWANLALQGVADRRFSWCITAEESKARAHLGCMQEEIKSLLYARSLPLTATGRKRPVLHLVEAHKRRMKNGTDVDISSFLRGQQHVDIDGTRFTIKPPATLRPALSTASERYFPKEDK
jgi:hypothetical protein